MGLHKLEINGFKSFAHKTVFDFSEPVVAIVGPNGSGKSNAVDAFRFVLGEGSRKAMRGTDSDDLLFNGSPRLRQTNRASVEATFHNHSNIFPLDFDVVRVKRVLHRDGTSDYLLNDTQVTRKKIRQLLGHANVGTSQHHIISQGETDKFLISKPEERAEILEEALGLSVYYSRIEESEKKLDKLKEDLGEVMEIKRELTPTYEYWCLEKEKREDYDNQVMRLTKVYRAYLQAESQAIKANQDKLNRLKQEAADIIKNTEKKLQFLKEDNQSLSRDDNSSAKLDEISTERASKQKDLHQIEQNIAHLEGQIAALQNNDEAIENTPRAVPHSVFQKLSSNLRSVIDANYSSIDEIKNDLKGIMAVISKALDKINKSDLHIAQEEKIETLHKKLDKHNEQKKELSKALEVLNSEYRRLKEHVSSSQQESHKDEIKELKLRQQIKEAKRQAEYIEEKQKNLAQRQERYEEEFKEARILCGRQVLDFGKRRDVEAPTHRDLERLKLKVEDSQVQSREVIKRELSAISEKIELHKKEISDIEESIENVRKAKKNLHKELETKFTTGVQAASTLFNEYCQTLFGGGEALLAIVELDNTKGIDVDIKLPRKNIRGLNMLSGGERSLVAGALLFALTQLNPPPFVVFDETDAALDEANSRRYSEMIKRIAEDTQLILITHNRETMLAADKLFGITLGGDGASRLLSINLKEAERMAVQE